MAKKTTASEAEERRYRAIGILIERHGKELEKKLAAASR
jgi:hypothetical protein